MPSCLQDFTPRHSRVPEAPKGDHAERFRRNLIDGESEPSGRSQNPCTHVRQKRLKTEHQLDSFRLFTKLQYYEHTSPVKTGPLRDQADSGCHLRARLHR